MSTQHTYTNAVKCSSLDHCVVATDDQARTRPRGLPLLLAPHSLPIALFDLSTENI